MEISDILHIPFLKGPGYGKVQVAIYLTALDDALCRIALDADDGLSSAAGVASGSLTRDPDAPEHRNTADVAVGKQSSKLHAAGVRIRGIVQHVICEVGARLRF